ncbi:MAG: hypothetical protein RL721_366 [Candidatus Eisenbacteria bacterium]
MTPTSTALRLTGRDALPLLHRTTSQVLADLAPGGARATLFCDFRGRLLHRAVVAVASDGAVWLLRADAPGPELAAAVDRMVFRDDVTIEDRSAELPFVFAPAPADAVGVLEERDGAPLVVAVGDGTLLARDGRPALTETERIARLLPQHGLEIREAFHPYEVGLGPDVHLAKGCFTGQEALQRLITYASVRRRLARVAVAAAVPTLPVEVRQGEERVGVLTSVAGGEGLAVLAHAAAAPGTRLVTDEGAPIEVIEAPEPARPIGRD